jgi:hypothetical protein
MIANASFCKLIFESILEYEHHFRKHKQKSNKYRHFLLLYVELDAYEIEVSISDAFQDV